MGMVDDHNPAETLSPSPTLVPQLPPPCVCTSSSFLFRASLFSLFSLFFSAFHSLSLAPFFLHSLIPAEFPLLRKGRINSRACVRGAQQPQVSETY